MYPRSCKPLLSNSFFLFGARGTGKSTLLKTLFREKKTVTFDLLDDQLAQAFLRNPGDFESQILEIPHLQNMWVIVDEIQRVPNLLNYVHRLIESHRVKFALTGSSARKLKRGGANLLAGRARLNYLHPFTAQELEKDFDLLDVLNWGALPTISTLQNPLERSEYLKAYVANYIKEEIKEEQILRKLEPFLRFIETSAQCNGQILNFSKIARDSGCDAKSIERYYEILKDTLLGFELPPFHESIRKRQSQKSKFYWFDLGVKRAVERTLTSPLTESTYAFGKAFEHFFILECFRLNDYFRSDYRFTYIKTKDDVEIDLIVERPGKTTLLIEVKSATRVDEKEFTNALRLSSEFNNSEFLVASREKTGRKLKGLRILPWQNVLTEIFEK